MANAAETLKAHVEASGWVFALAHLEKWRQDNQDSTLDDYLAAIRCEVVKAKARFVEVEVENGSTRESAERTVCFM